jgi:type IV secretory pathway VirB4 component
MIHFLEKLIATIWNRLQRRRGARSEGAALDLGFRVVDGHVTRRHFGVSNVRRGTHIAVLGKTGTGKSSFLRHLCVQDIEADRGFVYFDLHGDATPFLLRAINARERRLRKHLSDKLVIIDPADPLVSVGLNPLENKADFVRIAEFAQVLRQRWHLDHFGARTDELLRNSLYALSANGLTLVELAPFLAHNGFRASCLKRLDNAEVRQYFRHIIGQAQSTFSVREAMDEGYWVLVNLEKGRLGEQALTLGSLVLAVLKNALFTRAKRSLFTLYCDEIQNLVAYESGIETILSEARKFGVAVVSANQFLDQYPPETRAAILSVGTHAFFQLSSADAGTIAQALDGGKALAERLKNLPSRHCVVKSGSERWAEVRVPTVRDVSVDYTNLLNRSRYTKGRVRAHIERDIAKRQVGVGHSVEESLNDWE